MLGRTLNGVVAPLAQPAERKTFNLVAAGSSPAGGVGFFYTKDVQ